MVSVKQPVVKAVNYFKEAAEEMRKVTWPDRKTTIRYSVVVVIMCVVMAIFFAVLDAIFNLGLEGFLQIAG